MFLVRVEPSSPLTRVRREVKWVDDRPLSDMSDRRAPSEGIGSGEPPPRWTKNLPNAPTVRALVLANHDVDDQLLWGVPLAVWAPAAASSL